MNASPADAPRVLIVPGLHGSGDDHWQTWLQQRSRGSRRVEQADWAVADLDAWAARIGQAIEDAPPGGRWIAVAHSFGCLALLRHLHLRGAGAIVAALLAAPADPRRFGAEEQLLRRSPLREVLLVASGNDPWLSAQDARAWATCWDVPLHDAGEVGHLNPAAGFGPWPFAAQWVARRQQQWHARRRLDRAHPFELSWAV